MFNNKIIIKIIKNKNSYKINNNNNNYSNKKKKLMKITFKIKNK